MCQPYLLGRVISYFSPGQPASVNSTLPVSENATSLGGGITSVRLELSDATERISHVETTLTEAVLFAMGVCLSILLSNILLHGFMMSMFHLGMKARVGSCSLIYRKVGASLLSSPIVLLFFVRRSHGTISRDWEKLLVRRSPTEEPIQAQCFVLSLQTLRQCFVQSTPVGQGFVT